MRVQCALLLSIFALCDATQVRTYQKKGYSCALASRGGSQQPQRGAQKVVSPPGSSPSKKPDLVIRTTSAITLVSAVGTVVGVMRSRGLALLVVLGQYFMYNEVSRLPLSPTVSPLLPSLPYHRFLWFLTSFSATTLPAISPLLPFDIALPCNLVTFSLATLSLVSLVLSLASTSHLTPSLAKYTLTSLSFSALALSLLMPLTTSFITTMTGYGGQYLLFPLILVAINDSTAYFCGKAFGRTKLIPILSPSKTWEGFIGAALLTSGIGYAIKDVVGVSGSYVPFILVFTSLVAPFGGFLASTVKRAFGVKDFAHLIPGHGGVTDRMDCQVLAVGAGKVWLDYFS